MASPLEQIIGLMQAEYNKYSVGEAKDKKENGSKEKVQEVVGGGKEVGNGRGGKAGLKAAMVSKEGARKFTQAARVKKCKENKRHAKWMGETVTAIETRLVRLQKYIPHPPPFHDVALQLHGASLRAFILKSFLTRKTKGGGWRTQYGDEAHDLLFHSFKLELAKAEADECRWGQKLRALERAAEQLPGPQWKPPGVGVDEVKSALEKRWRDMAVELVDSFEDQVDVMEDNIKQELILDNMEAHELLRVV